jgi:hypothetical protein
MSKTIRLRSVFKFSALLISFVVLNITSIFSLSLQGDDSLLETFRDRGCFLMADHLRGKQSYRDFIFSASIDKDRPTILRMLNAIDRKTDAILNQLPPQGA